MNPALRTFNADARPILAADAGNVQAGDARLARVGVFREMAAAEPYWRALEGQAHFGTAYQSFDWSKAWLAHVGAAAGVAPFILVGFDAQGEAICLWPLGQRRMGGLRVLEFLGGKHSNFNTALWRGDFTSKMTADDLRDVLAQLGDAADLLMLTNQPMMWNGKSNPFALLPHQTSPSSGYSGELRKDFDALLTERTNTSARKKMRRKERVLAGLGDVTFERAEADSDVKRVLADFFAQKTARMRAIGLPNVFEPADVQRFVTEAALARKDDGSHVLELYTLSLDGTIVATIGGVASDGRFSAMFTSIIHGKFGAESVGEQLLVRLVRHFCERGFHTFDLGVGEAIYKGTFCPDVETLFDSYWPLTASGKLAAFALSHAAAAKRSVKQNPRLWAGVQRLRHLKAKFSGC
ncbi:MAG TPA: GNAT family N-acetyltransferase [Pseudolabrys sp.]|nr:GNAT family N-acetyltransferase [Pseudolabrys sp.]